MKKLVTGVLTGAIVLSLGATAAFAATGVDDFRGGSYGTKTVTMADRQAKYDALLAQYGMTEEEFQAATTSENLAISQAAVEEKAAEMGMTVDELVDYITGGDNNR